ncbi:MAG: hypothetical protein R8K47_03905 [Mariprofundaceae bacterium]
MIRAVRLTVLAAALMLAGCFSASDPVPEATIERLVGQWAEEDGPGRLRFWRDETVRLILPDMRPPLKVLSTLERIKDEDIGFSIGDRWQGPVHVILAPDGRTLVLRLEGEDGWERRFARRAP